MLDENKLFGECGDPCLYTEHLQRVTPSLTAMNGPLRVVTGGRCLKAKQSKALHKSTCSHFTHRLKHHTSVFTLFTTNHTYLQSLLLLFKIKTLKCSSGTDLHRNDQTLTGFSLR